MCCRPLVGCAGGGRGGGGGGEAAVIARLAAAVTGGDHRGADGRDALTAFDEFVIAGTLHKAGLADRR
ncbi:hypothetical protein, partial [Nocardia cyriacigeorgica]|uniref:hypothetical protein n=1 Tax=Nocardia cyriacigeorgica TaxID=135487 RepID=UPI002457210B